MAVYENKFFSNNDASEGRDKARIAERDKQELIAGSLLQNVCRLFAGYMLFSSHRTVSNPYLGIFSYFQSTDAWMGG